jgi:hypothetical protein
LPQKFAPRRVRLNQMRATFKPRVIAAPRRAPAAASAASASRLANSHARAAAAAANVRRVQPRASSRVQPRVQPKPKAQPKPRPQPKSARSPAVRSPFVQYLPAGGSSGMMCTIFLEVDGETREVVDPNCGGQSSQARPAVL